MEKENFSADSDPKQFSHNCTNYLLSDFRGFQWQASTKTKRLTLYCSISRQKARNNTTNDKVISLEKHMLTRNARITVVVRRFVSAMK